MESQSLRHAEDIEGKQASFICMIATPIALKYAHCRPNHTHQHTRSGTAGPQEVNTSNGWSSYTNNLQKKKGKRPLRCQARLRRWTMSSATGLNYTFSSTEYGEKRKNTLKMKPHRVQKSFQVVASQISMKIIVIIL